MARRTEVKPILPPKFNSKAGQRALEQGLREMEVLWRKALEGTTATWDDKPTFKVKMTQRGKMYVVRSEVSDKRWIWIDKGTRRHYIRPKRPSGVLAFPSRFTPKTKPNSLKARRGFSGPPPVYTKLVDHPGITPRNWSDMLSKRLTPRWRALADKAFVAYSYASGHGQD